MYANFEFYAPTRVVFGKGAEESTGKLLREQGVRKALIHYGGKSALASGLIGRIERALEAESIPFVSLGGVVPNPRLSLVYQGVELCRSEGVDFILAVGGGSVIDSAKAIAYGAANEGDVWDFFEKKREAAACLPLGVVLTIAAAGSEMSNGCVITNKKSALKRGYDSDLSRAKFAVMNPELTMTLPACQTASGAADILRHTMERYFNQNDNMALSDALSEALMRNVMHYARVLAGNPHDYKARAEIMWAGSLSHNGLTGCGTGGGDWSSHLLEHELGGLFDVAHGAGLAAVWGSWARYVCHAALPRFSQFAVNVLSVAPGACDAETAEAGIRAMEAFYRSIGMPTSLRELGVSPTDEQIERMAESCEQAGGGSVGCIVPLKKNDLAQIYRMAKEGPSA